MNAENAFIYQLTTLFPIRNHREDGSEAKTTKKKSLGIYLDNLLKKRTQFLRKDNVEGNAAASSAAVHEDDDNAAPSEATVIIEDEPPRKVYIVAKYFMLSHYIQYSPYFPPFISVHTGRKESRLC